MIIESVCGNFPFISVLFAVSEQSENYSFNNLYASRNVIKALINEDEIGCTCSTREKKFKILTVLVENPQVKLQLSMPWCGCDYNRKYLGGLGRVRTD
jgi:hypothetical protein